METARIAHHSLPRLPSNTGYRLPSSKFHPGIGPFRVSERPKTFFVRSNVRFSDSGHQQYYVLPRRETKKKEKEKSSEIKSVKKKLKFIKRLSSDLSLFSLEISGSVEKSGINLMNEEKISEAAKLLQAQLQQLKLEQKELKRNMKEQKALIKTTMKSSCKSKSSSTSTSESSDSDQGKVIDTIRLRSNLLKQSEKSEGQNEITEVTLAKPSLVIQQENSQEELRIGELSSLNSREDCCLGSEGECCSCNSFSKDQSHSIVEETSTKRIEICMGGKCKKSGAGALFEEFKRKAGGECDLSVCKCMGKCKNAPNIRVSEIPNGDQATRMQGYARPSINSFCIGVGLEDVDMILANIVGRDKNNNPLMASS